MQVETLLNKQLANWNVLYTKLHKYHWYVKGPHFFTLHEKFELFPRKKEHISGLHFGDKTFFNGADFALVHVANLHRLIRGNGANTHPVQAGNLGIGYFVKPIFLHHFFVTGIGVQALSPLSNEL